MEPSMAPQRTVGAEQHKETQEAEQHRQLAAAEMALLLLLQHDDIRTQLPVACTLLCCSKALAAAVAEHSVGQLDVPWLPANIAEQAAPWLRKHARLLRSLDLSIDDDPAAGVAPLIAAGPQSLALQSLKLQPSNATLPLLEQLPVSRLTDLELRMNDWSLQPQARPAFVARLSAALGRLTALRNLELYRRGCVGAPPLSGLSALTQLTALRFDGPVSDLQHAPPQLLELDGRWTDDEAQLDLRHLAAVTALSLLGDPVKSGDLLPPNLLRLEAYRCRSVQPLLPLVQLQHLELVLEAPLDITADQLRQLSRLTALSLHYDVEMDDVEPAGAGAWPLQRLELASVILSAQVCQHLAQLTGLTSLALQWCQLPQAGSAQQLAAALRQLSGLQQLELLHPLWPDTTSDADKAAGTRQLVQAICSLQRLRDLRCSRLAVLAAAAAGASSSSLTALTALTALSLSDCDLTGAAVTAIVSQLPGLQSLDCGLNGRLTDAALPAIGRLQQLTQLNLIGTRMTDAGLQHLGGLTRLQELELRHTRVTNAGMRHLTRLTRLQELRVPSNVTMQRRRWLQQQLPRLRWHD